MEAPPPAPPPPIAAAAATAVPTVVALPTYPDSVSSSPRSRLTDSCEADAPPTARPQKLRLMCSYGGHIIPRPHDKTLCYIGGDTRIIVIDRHASLSDLHNRLSTTHLHNHEYSLKYQLPNDDLDSLISVTTDEDLENMVEEYDRLKCDGGGLKPGRLRLFLFPKSSSMDQILVDSTSTKSEDWFLHALNGGKPTASDRGPSESSSVNCLLGLDDDLLGKSGVAKDVEAQLEGKKSSVEGNGNGNNSSATNQDAHPVPDSPMLETFSSFGSTSSSPSMANLPPIRVRVEENPKLGGVGIDEHYQQMTAGPVGVGGNVNLPRKKQEEVGGLVADGVVAGAVVSGLPAVVGGEYANQVNALLQTQHIPHSQQKQVGAIDLASQDSVSSDGSITNPLSRQRQAIYQEPGIQNQSGNDRDVKTRVQITRMVQMQPQGQESGYVFSSQFDQNHAQLNQTQQFVHTGMQYIPAGAVPITPYYPMYTSRQQHHPHQPLLDQQYPVYFMPARQAQAYSLPVQPPNYNELIPNAPSSGPQIPPPTAASPLAAYNPVVNARSQLEIGAGAYREAASSTPARVPVDQIQPQYVGFSQVPRPNFQ